MSEQTHNQALPRMYNEVAAQTAEIGLHRQAIELPNASILGIDETREKYGYNGQLMAEITLPAAVEGAPGTLKKLGVIDYGESANNEGVAIFYDNGKPMVGMGKTRARFGLVNLNYAPKTHSFASKHINEEPIHIGRSEETGDDMHSYMNDYGLYNTSENSSVSRNHLTVRKNKAGNVVIEDTSTNGTSVRYAETSSNEPEMVEQTEAPIGILGGAAMGAEVRSEYHDLLFGERESATNLTPTEQRAADQRRIEQAAVRTRNPFEILSNAEKTETGTYQVKGELADEFIASLSAFGASGEFPSTEQVSAGIQRAKRLTETGQAAATLARLPFMDNDTYQRLVNGTKKYFVNMDQTAYVDPALIRGADTHASWAGGGYMGQASVGIREAEVSKRLNGQTTRPSIDKITDYATRETQLPKYDYASLSLILTNDGPIFYAANAHRTSAAKLRNEPIGFSSVVIHDARK